MPTRETRPTRKDSGSCASKRPMHAAKICEECPWKRSTPPGQFTAARFEALRDTSGSRNNADHDTRAVPEVGLDAPMFACHKTAEGKEVACAGWLAVEGADHLGIRLAVITGHIPADALAPKPGWPMLFDDYEEMAAAQGRVSNDTVTGDSASDAITAAPTEERTR